MFRCARLARDSHDWVLGLSTFFGIVDATERRFVSFALRGLSQSPGSVGSEEYEPVCAEWWLLIIHILIRFSMPRECIPGL